MPRKAQALPPSVMDISGIRLHAGQVKMVISMREYEVVCNSAARRWGKTEGRRVAVVDQVMRSNGFIEGCCGAQSHAEAKNLYEKDLLAWGPWCNPLPKANEDQRRFLEFPPLRDADSVAAGFANSGCRVWYPSLGDDHSAFQAHGLQFAILDEMALEGPGAWEDTIRPMLGDTGGHALLYGAAYPEGKNFAGWAALWQKGNPNNKKRNPAWFSMSGASWENPYINGAAMRKQYMEMVESGQEAKARCLYLGEFVTDLGAVFRGLDAAFVLPAGIVEPGLWRYRKPRPDERCVLGLDLGKHDDSSVASLFSVDTCEQLAALRMSGDYIPQLRRIDALYRESNRPVVMADARGNETTLELLVQRYGDGAIPVKWSSGGRWDKESQIVRAQTMFQQGAWKFMDIPEQREEFRLYAKEEKPSGGWTYNAPDGCHDDFVTAACYALYQLPFVGKVIAPEEPDIAQGSDAWWSLMESTQIRPQFGGNAYSLRRQAR